MKCKSMNLRCLSSSHPCLFGKSAKHYGKLLTLELLSLVLFEGRRKGMDFFKHLPKQTDLENTPPEKLHFQEFVLKELDCRTQSSSEY